MEAEESDELKRLRQMERHQKLYEGNIRDLHSCIEVKDIRIKELEKENSRLTELARKMIYGDGVHDVADLYEDENDGYARP